MGKPKAVKRQPEALGQAASVEPGPEPQLWGSCPPWRQEAASKLASKAEMGMAIFVRASKSQILSRPSKGKVHPGIMHPNVFLNYMLSGRRHLGNLWAQRQIVLAEENALKDTFPVFGQLSHCHIALLKHGTMAGDIILLHRSGNTILQIQFPSLPQRHYEKLRNCGGVLKRASKNLCGKCIAWIFGERLKAKFGLYCLTKQ